MGAHEVREGTDPASTRKSSPACVSVPRARPLEESENCKSSRLLLTQLLHYGISADPIPVTPPEGYPAAVS